MTSSIYSSARFFLACEMHAYKMHVHERHANERHAYEGFCEDLARQNTVAHPSQLQLGFWRCRILVMLSHMGFHVVAYGFQSPWWRPKGQYLGRCTVCLGTSAHRPCFDPSVCLQPVCLSFFCPSDWLTNPIAYASFPRLTLPLCR